MKTMIALRHDARRLYPHSRSNQSAWLKSVFNLRKGPGWVLEGAQVRWGYRVMGAERPA